MNAPRSRRRLSSIGLAPRSVFLAFFALTFIALACWSFADPLVAAPDEQAHFIRAYAIDHGQLGHGGYTYNKALVEVSVPAAINFTKAYPRCFQFRAAIPANCAPTWTRSTAMVRTTTYVGHYPPLYYLLVGVGSLFSAHVPGLYLMRLASSLVSAFMLALCAYTIARWSKRRALAAGVAVTLTPIVWFLAASVNPSGFEITTAICLWTALTIFALDYPENPPRGLVAVIGGLASTLVLVRGLSPLFVVIIGAVVALLVGPRRLGALVRRRRDVQWAAAGVVVAALLAAAWILTQGTLNIAPDGAKVDSSWSEWHIIRLVLRHVHGWIQQSVGVLGWLDTPMPQWFYNLWYLIVIGVVVTGFVVASRRGKVAVLAITALSLLVPIVLVTRQAHQLGIVWQGRDSMPLAVGVPILGAGLWTRSRHARSLQKNITTVIVALVTLLTLGSFYLNLRRYSVGRTGTRLFFWHHEAWSPPTGTIVTMVVYGVVTMALGALVIAWLRSSRHHVDDVFVSSH